MTSSLINRRLFLTTIGAASAIGTGFVRPVRPRAQSRVKTPVTIANASGINTLIMGELMRQQQFFEHFDLAATVVHVSDGNKITSSIIGGETDITAMSGFGPGRVEKPPMITQVPADRCFCRRWPKIRSSFAFWACWRALRGLIESRVFSRSTSQARAASTSARTPTIAITRFML